MPPSLLSGVSGPAAMPPLSTEKQHLQNAISNGITPPAAARLLPDPDAAARPHSASSTPVSPTEDESEAVAELRLSTLTPIFVFALIYLVLIVVFATQRALIIPLMERFVAWARGYGIIGYVCIGALALLTAIPPVPGYGPVAVLAGVVYGWMGLVPFYIGAVLGACVTFLIFRKLATGYAHRLQQERPRVAAVVRAVERRGFKILFFIRCAPYPYSLLNAILAASPKIPFWSFFAATALTVPKMAINVGLGAHLKDIAEALFEHPTPARWALIAAFFVLSIAVFVYIGWIGMKEIRELEREGSASARHGKKLWRHKKGQIV